MSGVADPATWIPSVAAAAATSASPAKAPSTALASASDDDDDDDAAVVYPGGREGPALDIFADVSDADDEVAYPGGRAGPADTFAAGGAATPSGFGRVSRVEVTGGCVSCDEARAAAATSTEDVEVLTDSTSLTCPAVLSDDASVGAGVGCEGV